MNEILQKIRENYELLTASQQRVADVVLNNYTCLALMTSSSLARLANVSEATTVRFAMRLGYAGYGELRRAVQDGLMENRTVIKLQESIGSAEEGSTCYAVAMKRDIENINRTLQHLDVDMMESAVEKLCRAKRVFILGRMRSEAIAVYLDAVLKMLLDQPILLDANTTLESVSDIGEDDCLFAISFKRYSKETVQIQKYFKRKGAFCIALTDSNASPLAGTSDLLFRAEVRSVSFVDSYAAAVSVVNSIWTRITQRNPGKSQRKLEVLEELYKEVDVFY